MQSVVQPPPTIELDGHGLKIGIVVARYNWHITGSLLALACEELTHLGVVPNDIRVVTIPGSFELTSIALALLRSTAYDALICLGCVIKGETRHDVLVGDAAAQGIQRLALDTGIPIIFGVLCTENQQQAEERIARGKEFAYAAIEMACTIATLKKEKQ